MMYRYIQKALDWGVKIASLAVTGPATWVVATILFSDIQSPLLLFLMRFAAVFLIEGVLLSNWLLLEFDKNATPEIKARYGITALAMYLSLLVIGWQHEGPTGLVFRVALLAALIGSGWDTYVYTWQKATARTDKSIENSIRYRTEARKLALKEAIYRRRRESGITITRIDVEADAGLEAVRLEGQRKLTAVSLDHDQQTIMLTRAMPETSVESGKLPVIAAPIQPQLPAPKIRLDATDKKMLKHYSVNPKLSTREMQKLIGLSHTTIGNRLRRMQEQGIVHCNGNGVEVL